MYVLQTLGAVALHRGPAVDLTGEPLLRGSKTLVLATYLAEHPDRSAPREHLAELFWPAVPRSQARRSLRQALYYLAQAGGKGMLESEGQIVRLDVDCCTLDAELFEQALREERFEDAVELYRGPFLQGFDSGKSRELATWIESVRERLEVGHRQALRESTRTSLGRGDPDQAVEYARRAAAAFPLDDPIHALLLESLIAAGHPGEAVREYEAYRVLLREELEDVPSGDITEIAERARELALQRTAEAVQAPVGEAPLEQGPPTGAPTDRRRPAPEPSTGPLGLLLRAVPLVLITAAILFFGLRWMGWSSGPGGDIPVADAPADKPAAEPRVFIRANQRVQGGMRPMTLELQGTGPARAVIVPGSEGELDRLAFPSPNGRYEALRVYTAQGPDVEIRDARTGDLVARVPNQPGRTPDDHTHGWSPDSRQLLFDSGLFDAQGEYDKRLFLFDVESRSVRPLSQRRIPDSRGNSWSPRGDRIAFEGYRDGAGPGDVRTDIFLVSIDGVEVGQLTDDDARESEISWSPDGTRLVYRKGDLSSSDIHVLDVESGTDLPIAASGWTEREPVWISNEEVAFITVLGEDPDVWVVSADGSAQPRRLTDGLQVASLLQRLGPAGSVPWIESVRASVSSPGRVLSPGEHTVLEVTVEDAEGKLVHPEEAGLEWRILDPDRATLVDDRLLSVRDTGQIRLVADIGGWRADTLVLESRPLTESAADLLLEQRWGGGFPVPGWQEYGTPEPTVRAGGGPDGAGTFRNEGDKNSGSGALTTRRFPSADGISVESWGRVPLTGGHFQTWELELAERLRRDPASTELLVENRAGKIQLISEGANAGYSATLASGQNIVPMPEPPRIEEWRLHTLQLHPDGVIEWIIDGRRHGTIHSHRPVPDSVQVAIGGRTVGTDIEHGTVRVWQGLRYVPQRD